MRILVFSAHCADFCSRAGGTIAKHARDGDEVRVVALTFGERSESGGLYADGARPTLADVKAVRREEAERASAVLGAGIEVLSPCRRALVSLSMNCYFLENANQSECDSYDDNYGNGMDLGLGVRYTATPRLDLSAGYQYSDLGGSDTTYNDLEFSLDSHFIGAGARYEVSPGLDLTGSVAKLFCTEGEGAGRFGGSIYNKDIWYFGLGAGLSLPSD